MNWTPARPPSARSCRSCSAYVRARDRDCARGYDRVRAYVLRARARVRGCVRARGPRRLNRRQNPKLVCNCRRPSAEGSQWNSDFGPG